jgi:hypothetical protein
MSISDFTLSSTCATVLIEKQLALNGVAMIGTVSEYAIVIMMTWNGNVVLSISNPTHLHSCSVTHTHVLSESA